MASLVEPFAVSISRAEAEAFAHAVALDEARAGTEVPPTFPLAYSRIVKQGLEVCYPHIAPCRKKCSNGSMPASATSGLLVFGIIGGAILPLVAGRVADAAGVINPAFFVPLAGYVLLVIFAVAASRAKVHAIGNAHVHAITAKRRMQVAGITYQKSAATAVAFGNQLPSALRISNAGSDEVSLKMGQAKVQRSPESSGAMTEGTSSFTSQYMTARPKPWRSARPG
eukprot:gene57671-76974_t